MPVAARRLLFAVAALSVLLLGLALGGRWARVWVEQQLLPVDPTAGQTVIISITPGLSTGEVATLLRRKGLVRDPRVFRYYARFLKLDSQLQGGEYELTAAMSVEEILRKLSRGQVVVRRFTVPEGLSLVQTADVLANKGIIKKERFLELAADTKLAEKYLPEVPLAHPLEGYLFPSTYDYRPGITEAETLALMFVGFEKVWTTEFRQQADQLKLTVHEVMTLASIIEKEARVAAERPIISGVYHNRLRAGMKLDADPTVRYALGKPPEEPLLYIDLAVESPYNTYRVAGLPPGPIAAPGALAIRAALFPEKHDFWYFVAKGDGSGEHYFAETLAQHDAYTEKAEANLATATKQ